jgi:predicted component of type VI protein secretion system
MAESFQNEVPKARVNIKLDLHTGGAQKKAGIAAQAASYGRLQQRPRHARSPSEQRFPSTKTISIPY